MTPRLFFCASCSPLSGVFVYETAEELVEHVKRVHEETAFMGYLSRLKNVSPPIPEGEKHL